MINEYINELVAYGLNQGLVDPEDEVYVTNRLLELFQLTEHEGTAKEVRSERELSQILNDMLEYAYRQGMLEEETITEKDLFDTKIMGILTPNPSVVRRQFWDKYSISPKAATDFYYQFSQATNYIRKDRIAKDEKWTANTEFGAMDITINLSKPEKDPCDIAKAGKAKKSGYPSCLLCKENEGYAGHLSHPAMRRCLQKNTGRTSCLQKIFGVHIKKGPFHICEVACFFSIQFSQIVLLARLCMIYMLKVSFIES